MFYFIFCGQYEYELLKLLRNLFYLEVRRRDDQIVSWLKKLDGDGSDSFLDASSSDSEENNGQRLVRTNRGKTRRHNIVSVPLGPKGIAKQKVGPED